MALHLDNNPTSIPLLLAPQSWPQRLLGGSGPDIGLADSAVYIYRCCASLAVVCSDPALSRRYTTTILLYVSVPMSLCGSVTESMSGASGSYSSTWPMSARWQRSIYAAPAKLEVSADDTEPGREQQPPHSWEYPSDKGYSSCMPRYPSSYL